jgi:hypothetical protein
MCGPVSYGLHTGLMPPRYIEHEYLECRTDALHFQLSEEANMCFRTVVMMMVNIYFSSKSGVLIIFWELAL